MIALYKRIRPTVQLGDLYRLLSPRTERRHRQPVCFGRRQAVRALRLPPLAAIQHRGLRPFPLRGLDERALYRLESIDGKLVEHQPQLSGAYLMSSGLNLNLRGDFDSTAVILERVN